MTELADLPQQQFKHSEATVPLLELLDELMELTEIAARTDMSARLRMSRARLADPRVRLAVVGEPHSGVSTLVNSLVGASVSVVSRPSGVPVVVEYGASSATTLVSEVGGRTQRQPVTANSRVPVNDGVVRAEVVEPSPLLAEGIVVMDAPGGATDSPVTWSLIAAADAVLFVADAGRPVGDEHLEWMQRIQQVCPTIVVALNKIDRYPHWVQVQRQDRELLDGAGLGFAVAPISALQHSKAKGDTRRDVESGVPQLIDHLRDYVLSRADTVARSAAVRDIDTIAEHLAAALRTEAEALHDRGHYRRLTDRLQAVRAEADELRQRCASWQVTLAEGGAELAADVEHDLRHRLRALVRDAEIQISERDPGRRWRQFGVDLDGRIADAVTENFALAHRRCSELADQVAANFPGGDEEVTVTALHVGEPSEVLQSVTKLEPLPRSKFAVTQPLLNALRGSYGGILMVGLATSLLGMSLVNWYSAGAGVLLGVNALWDESRQRRLRRQAEAKVAVARLMDDVIFQISKESRNRLRTAQHALRAHYTERATRTLRSVDQELRAAEEATTVHSPAGRVRRLGELESALARLREIRAVAKV